MTPITEDKVKEILRLISFGIPKGLGEPVEGKMCIEHIVAHAFGEGITDKPSCVGSEVQRAKIVLNDSNWSSNTARALGMTKIGVAQLGSVNLDQKEFFDRLKLALTKRVLPYLIQQHFDKCGDKKLLEYKTRFENLVALDDNLWREFYSDYDNYYNYYNAHYSAHYYAHYGDKYLLLIADVILSVLIDMNCEGCKYLHLVENFQLAAIS